MADLPIYLDNHATTRVDPRVVEAMLPYFTEQYGNAGSVVHAYGEAARQAVEQARCTIAQAIGADESEIVFTSGATESNNLAIRGVAQRRRRRGDHLVTVRTEHRSVLAPVARLEQQGYTVTLLDVEPQASQRPGWLPAERVAAAITEQTCLVSVILANNEIGIVQPLAGISQHCRQQGVLLHCDATQAVGKLPVDVDRLGVDLMSFTAHKLHGPKGIGALYVRKRDPVVRLEPQSTGGGQERGRRSGTLNVAGIVGFAAAVQLAVAELSSESLRVAALRNRLAEGIMAAVEGTTLIGPALEDRVEDFPVRLPQNLNLLFPDVDAEAVMLAMPELAVSSGSACSSVAPEPSHVLQALGLSADQVRCSLRFGLSRFTTAEEIERAVDLVAKGIASVRQQAGGSIPSVSRFPSK